MAIPPARPLVLVVLDGFGIGRDPHPDAIAAARMPNWRRLVESWPASRVGASEEAVGLPPGQMGNSEVGHLNLGAGRPVLQDLPRIDAAIADGSFAENAPLIAALHRAAVDGRRVHLIGLVGPGGVHSVDRHAVAIAELAARHGALDLVVHAFLDGRDTPPRSVDAFLPDFVARLAAAHPDARVATVGGRYYGMDRDRRWERTKAAYDAIVHATAAVTAPDPLAAVLLGYERGENDEFVQPTLVAGVDGRVRERDVVIHFNFRADRARQLVHALVDGDDFVGFERGERPRDLAVVTLTEYEAGLPVAVAFPPLRVLSLAEHFSSLGWRQFHVAETEKYAHVTYFLNGGVEEAWPGEARLLVPSPQVATYDLRPEMSARAVTRALVQAIRSGEYEFIVANYANPDMVGHTGNWDATVSALEHVDSCLGDVMEAFFERDREVGVVDGRGAVLCVTADHGNADEMRDADGAPVTAHSLNPVPVVLAGAGVAGRSLRDGVLADVAPTLLELLGHEPLPGMTGSSLLHP